MFEFKKTKSSEKILTEKEIQQKLYGRFLNSNAAAGATEPVGKPAHSTAPAASATSLFPEDREETVSAAPLAESAPQVRFPEKKAELSETAPLSTGDKTKEKLRGTDLDSFRSIPKPKIARPQSYQTEKPKSFVRIDWKSLMDKGADGIVSIARGISKLFSGASRIVDFRRDSVRTGISWGGGAFVLVLLLVAIHGLNAKRELAMKKAPLKQRQTVVKTVKKIPKVKHDKEEVKTASTASVAEQPQDTVTAAGTLAQESPLKPAEEGLESGTEKKVAAVSKKESEPSVAKGRFVIQVATYVIKDDATRLMDDLKKSESRVFIKGLTRASGKTYYSVFIGRFKTFQDAQQAVAGFKKTDLARSFKDAFIRTLDN